MILRNTLLALSLITGAGLAAVPAQAGHERGPIVYRAADYHRDHCSTQRYRDRAHHSHYRKHWRGGHRHHGHHHWKHQRRYHGHQHHRRDSGYRIWFHYRD